MSVTRLPSVPLAPSSQWDDQAWHLAEANARRLFNPASPINEDQLFSGRLEQVSDLLNIVYERGAHAILYGERGVGKSSLANVITSKIPANITNIKFLKENCRPEDIFFSLWSKVLFDHHYEGVAISDYLKDEDRHYIVVKILESLSKTVQYVFVFDEFDRIASSETKAAMADTIKHFSDYPQNVTIVIVGVGFSIEELFGSHPSIQRCCQQIQMPRMADIELKTIIDERYPQIGIQSTKAITNQMVQVSQGLPGYMHLIGRESALSSLRSRRTALTKTDFEEAISESVRRAQESIVSSYKRAVYSAKDNIYKEVLLACALTTTDELGKFSASAIREKLCEILNRRVEIASFARHLAAFCDASRGPILRKVGKAKRFQYQFIEAPLQPYIVMAGKKDGLI